jgi:hypothetical protein
VSTRSPACRDQADAVEAACDDGKLPRHGISCRGGIGSGSVGGGGGAVDRGGPVPCGSATPQAATGGRPVGLRCSLSDTPPPSQRSEDAIAIHETPSRTPPTTRGPHEGSTEGGGSGEEEGAPGPATTDEARSYLDLFFNTCRVN